MKKQKKRPITLLEIMIVIFLIGLIGSVVGYNMKGSLDKGRVFKSEQGAAKIKEILNLQLAEGSNTIQEIVANPLGILKNSHLVDKPEKTFKDGWNHDYFVKQSDGGDIEVYSIGLISYKKKTDQPLTPEEQNLVVEAERGH